MQAKAEARYIRISPQKARLVVDLIRGQKAGQALTTLRTTNKRIAPTVDLTIHFRGPLPQPAAEPGERVLAVFRTRLAREGFLEEDGELWSRDGVLLAHSRQLALLR